MGALGRRLYERRYSPEQNYRQLLAIYEQAVRSAAREGAPAPLAAEPAGLEP